MAEVELKNISKIYEGKSKAVDNVSLKINDKEFVVIVGPSGCGKSTTLRMVAGLEEITSGELFIDGKLVNDVLPKDRDIAMVFQNYALYPHMTVYENMAFGLKLRKFNKQEIDERVNYAAVILELEEYLNRKPKQLSGGQRQRVAVGRAIVRKPKVFLFDEPLSNLDAKLRVQMRTEISKLHQKVETTMIYVTHDQVEAMTMGDRIVIMKDGIIQQVDSPLNIYNNPSNKFVAGFIGSPAMNFIEGKVCDDNGLLFISKDKLAKIRLNALPENLNKKIVNKEIYLGVRPENIFIDEEKENENDLIEAKVEVTEPLGNETLVYLRTGEDQLIARLKPSANIYPGKAINISFDQKHLHFFDKETELSVN